jgi:hypothetical protein
MTPSLVRRRFKDFDASFSQPLVIHVDFFGQHKKG